MKSLIAAVALICCTAASQARVPMGSAQEEELYRGALFLIGSAAGIGAQCNFSDHLDLIMSHALTKDEPPTSPRLLAVANGFSDGKAFARRYNGGCGDDYLRKAIEKLRAVVAKGVGVAGADAFITHHGAQ